MKPFKKPYKIALAGGLSATALGLAAAAAADSARRWRGAKPLSHLDWAAAGLGAGACFAMLYYPPYARRGTEVNTVYLTFDDGPDPMSTPAVLDALERYSARATFFVLGAAAREHPDLIRAIAERGHAIGVHGYTHDGVTLQGMGRIDHDLGTALNAIRVASDTSVKLYRPPYGLRGPALACALRRRALRMQLWSLNSYDYLYQAAAPLAERLHTRLQSGDIVLLHDAGETGRATAAALPSILTDILSRGWRSECLDK